METTVTKQKPTSSAKRTTPRKPRGSSKKIQKKKSSWLFYLLSGSVISIFLGIGIKFFIDSLVPSNPLIGKWRTQTALGIMEVEFDATTMSVFGTKNAVSYDIQKDNKIIVFDEKIKVGKAYTLIDDKTMSTEAGGFKTVYKKVIK